MRWIFLAGILLFTLATASYYFFTNFSFENRLDTTPTQVSPQSQEAVDQQYIWEITDLATGLEVPWDLSFTPEKELFITERTGRVKLLKRDGEIATVATLSQVVSTGEAGLTGIALHPNFSTNGYVYLYYTYRSGREILNKVSRYTYRNERLSGEKTILDKLPGGSIHNGGRLKFGPDEKLWILTGDAAKPELAQDPNSLGGKVLRINDDGSIPADNPDRNSRVYSLGHRNPQGLDFHPLTEELVVTEHGESAYDEINLIKPDGNYGWPEIKRCDSNDPKLINPLLCSNDQTWAPSGGAFLGTEIDRFRNSYFFAGLRGQILERVDIVNDEVVEREVLIKDTYGRLRAVTTDGEGNLYVTTSNKDGRGNPKQGDDRILKISPKKVE